MLATIKTTSEEIMGIEPFLKALESRKERGRQRAHEANIKGIAMGPEIYPRKTVLEAIECKDSWLRNRKDINNDVFFSKEGYGHLSFNFSEYYNSQRNKVEGAVLHDQFKDFYKVALKQINEHTGMFSLEILDEKYDMSTSNALFFVEYMLSHKLVTEDPMDPGTYYLASEYSEDELAPTPTEETEPAPPSPATPAKKILIEVEPNPSTTEGGGKKTFIKTQKKIDDLQARLKDLGPGCHSRGDIFKGTDIDPGHFYSLRDRVPFLIQAGSRKYTFDFWSYYDKEKMTKTGVELAREVDRFFRKEIISLRNGTCTPGLNKIFDHDDLTNALFMAKKNADFLIWYLTAYEIVKPCEDCCYEWVAPEQIQWVVQSICPELMEKAPPLSGDEEETHQVQYGLLPENLPQDPAPYSAEETQEKSQEPLSGRREKELEAALRNVVARVKAVFEHFDENNPVRAGAELSRIEQTALAALEKTDGYD